MFNVDFLKALSDIGFPQYFYAGYGFPWTFIVV